MRIARAGVIGVSVVLVGCTLGGTPDAGTAPPRGADGRLPAGVSRAMADADEVTLYSLEPAGLGAEADPAAAGSFHGHKVLGSVTVSGADRRKLVAALRRGVDDHDGSVAACFIPHHGVRLRTGERTTDLVVCFQCAQVKVYQGREVTSFLVSRSPRPAFNDLLDRAKVPVADAGRR